MTDSDRPAPVVLTAGGGLHLPGEWCTALVVALEALQTVLVTQRAPVGCRQPSGLSRAQRQLLSAARAAAAGYERQRHRRSSSAGFEQREGRELAVSAGGNGGVGDLAVTVPASSAEVTTAGAVELAGLTDRRWRQLAAEGLVGARLDGTRWLLSRAAVTDYSQRGQGR